MRYSHDDVDEAFIKICIKGGEPYVRTNFENAEQNRVLIKAFSDIDVLFLDSELGVFDKKNRAQWPYMWDFLQEHVKVNGACPSCVEGGISHCEEADTIICGSGMTLNVNASGFTECFPRNHNVQYFKFYIDKATRLNGITKKLLDRYKHPEFEEDYRMVPFYIVAGIIIMNGGVSVKTLTSS